MTTTPERNEIATTREGRDITRPWIDGLVQGSPELRAVGTLLEESRRGVAFSRAASLAVRKQVLAFGAATPQQQWLGLLKLLLDLSEDAQRTPLATHAMEPAGGARDAGGAARAGPDRTSC